MRNKTIHYLRENYPWFDRGAGLITKFLTRLKSIVVSGIKKTIDIEIDNYVFRVAENLPYGLMILFLGFFLVIGIIRATETENGLKVYNITTSSMDPVIKPGSLVFSFPKEVYKKGDIINYKEKNQKTKTYTGRVLTHRIIDITEKDRLFAYTAKGDNNEHPDPNEIRTADIMGSVFLILPLIGYVDYLIRTIPGFLLFIGVPVLLLLREVRFYLKQKN